MKIRKKVSTLYFQGVSNLDQPIRTIFEDNIPLRLDMFLCTRLLIRYPLGDYV